MAIVKYTKELTDALSKEYQQGATPAQLAEKFALPERSIIAKLSNLGIYRKKTYTDKQGNPPVKKEFYVEKIANALEIDLDLAESLTKVNKVILKRILEKLGEIF